MISRTLFHNFCSRCLMVCRVSNARVCCWKWLCTHALYPICCRYLLLRSSEMQALDSWFLLRWLTPSGAPFVWWILFSRDYSETAFFLRNIQWDVQTCFRAICRNGCATGVVHYSVAVPIRYAINAYIFSNSTRVESQMPGFSAFIANANNEKNDNLNGEYHCIALPSQVYFGICFSIIIL